MIVFVYGTTAEAIKLAPIARRLRDRGIAYQQWVTMQHTEALRQVLPQLGLPEPDRIIADGNKGKPLRRPADVLNWLWQVASWLRRNRRVLRRTLPKNTVIIVHGDTMTSVVGAYIARRLKVACAHVEAGLRSGNWRHPFPEELDRRIVGRWASIHYAPSEEAVANLAGRPNVVPTHGNTVLDAVLDHDDTVRSEDDEYGLVLLHRFEFISNQQLVADTVATLARKAQRPIKMLVDAYNTEALVEATQAHRDLISIESKQSHADFVVLLRSAEFVVTDSGGVQEEAALLGTPTLVHRMATERYDGIGENAVLSRWSQEAVGEFLTNYASYRKPLRKPAVSPSSVVVEDLLARGFA
jgi:UDP-N-acetylglucosamine 2-epimerase (non-hydrolysing)